ncbi:BACON domain-containing protein [Streptomyces sp. PTD5-9]|uniref:BACON domain-containing protein n=1 Tax=Streptomyces sp. PTD5-9 TaxID=3120150 RepID=UPI00300A5380
MTSSRLEPPTHTTGAHRVRRRAPHSSTQPVPQRPPVRHEPHLDGLFTYCLSVLCDHDAATEALGGVLAIAERQDARCPEGEEERKSWLYALARWMCLRMLAERRQGRRAHHPEAGRSGGQPAEREPQRGREGRREAKRAGGQPGGPAAQGARAGRRTPPAGAGTAPSTPCAPGGAPTDQDRAAAAAETAEAHRRELAQLAWPEAAGTTPEQREALELAVRHRLTPQAVASVLGLEPAAARELLAAAACEVERTRAALAVVESGNCPTVARLTDGRHVLLSATLCRELVRHVDDCPRCRRAAERVGADGPWPGTPITPAAALPVVPAPRPSAYVASAHARRGRSGGPRFDRTGFPLHPKDHAARRDRLRARVVTTTVVATVVAAPVIALWTAYRGAPQPGEGHEGAWVTATGTDLRHDPGAPHDHYETAGNARPRSGDRFGDGRAPGVSAEVISAGPTADGRGGLAVEARSSGPLTLVRLTASGGAAVAWSARADVSWLRLSDSSGTLGAGESVTVRIVVDRLREPAGRWSARVALAPSGSVVAIRGRGAETSSGVPDRPGVPALVGPSAPSPRPPFPPGPGRPGEPAPAATGSAPTPAEPGPTDSAPAPDPSAPQPSTEPDRAALKR